VNKTSLNLLYYKAEDSDASDVEEIDIEKEEIPKNSKEIPG